MPTTAKGRSNRTDTHFSTVACGWKHSFLIERLGLCSLPVWFKNATVHQPLKATAGLADDDNNSGRLGHWRGGRLVGSLIGGTGYDAPVGLPCGVPVGGTTMCQPITYYRPAAPPALTNWMSLSCHDLWKSFDRSTSSWRMSLTVQPPMYSGSA